MLECRGFDVAVCAGLGIRSVPVRYLVVGLEVQEC